MAEVSVIIVNYNTVELTKRAISSVIQQTEKTTFEITVVDNGSIPEQASIIKQSFPNIKVIRSEENLGFAAGNNLGIKYAGGNYVLLLNSDTELLNDAIGIGTKFMDINVNVGVLGGRLEYPDGRLQNNCQRFPSWKYKLVELMRWQKLFSTRSRGELLYGSFFDHQSLSYPDWIWGTFFLFRRNILDILPNKKLNDEYFMYGEDMQWCWDIRKLGLEIVFNPEAKIMHIMEGSGGSKGKWVNESYKKFLKKNRSRFHSFLILVMDKLL